MFATTSTVDAPKVETIPDLSSNYENHNIPTPQRTVPASFVGQRNTSAGHQKIVDGPATGIPPDILRRYLESKGSPLARYSEYLMQQKHWRLLIAISSIESVFCKRLLAYNCWGIGGDAHYRYYKSYPEAMVDADTYIESWQQRGRWLTVEDMNCSYVVPCNKNWVMTVNKILQELSELK